MPLQTLTPVKVVPGNPYLKIQVSSAATPTHPKHKILHITQALGGVRTYLENILCFSNENNFEYVIIAPPDDSFQQYCAERKITYLPISIKRGIDPFGDIKALWKIVRAIRKVNPDVIHVHSAKGGFLGRLAGNFVPQPIIYTPHAFSYLSFKGGKRIMFYMLEYVARKWSSLLLAVSYSEANRASFELGYPQNKISTLVNSVTINKSQIRKDYSGNTHIGMIGRLTHQKNPMLFLEIAARIIKANPDVQFSLLGGGLHDHLSEEIKDFIAQHKLSGKVHILPWGDSNSSKEFLQNIDIFLMTSAFEGMPFSLLEAMAMGIPSVVSVADGNSDIIQNNLNGFACMTTDQFCAKLELLIADESLRKDLGQAAALYVAEKHNITKTIRQLEDIYSSYSEKRWVIDSELKAVPLNRQSVNAVATNPLNTESGNGVGTNPLPLKKEQLNAVGINTEQDVYASGNKKYY